MRYGVDCCERVTPYYFLAQHIHKTLVEYKKHMGSHPSYMTKAGWDEALDSMIWSFKYITENDYGQVAQTDSVQKGLDLFAKHFRSLWS